MQKRVSCETLILACALVGLLVGSATYVYLLKTTSPNVNLSDLPTGASFVIKNDDSIIRAIAASGQIAYQGADAYTVIQNAINATLPGTGGLIYVTDGNYTLTKSLMLWRYISLVGQSKEGVTFNVRCNCDGIQVRYRPADTEKWIGFNYISQLTLSGRKGAYTAGNGIRLMNLSDNIIQANFIDNFPGDGIRIDYSYYSHINQNWIESNGGNGINIPATTTPKPQEIWIFQNTIFRSGLDGIHAGGLLGLWISDNWFLQNAHNGINEAGAYDGNVVGNSFESNCISGASFDQLVLDSAANTPVTGNIFVLSGFCKYAVWFWSPQNVAFTGNSFDGRWGKSGAVYVSGSLRKGFILKNNAALNPLGLISAPFDTSYSYIGLNQVNATQPVGSSTYTVSGSDLQIVCAGGTGLNITVTDGHGNNILAGGATLGSASNPFILYQGESINFGPFTVAPTVTVYGT